MGFLREGKANTLGLEAQKAAESGRMLFTPRLNMPATANNMSGDVPDWAMMIESIEAAGWTMVDWSVGMDTKGRAEAFPVFRRV